MLRSAPRAGLIHCGAMPHVAAQALVVWDDLRWQTGDDCRSSGAFEQLHHRLVTMTLSVAERRASPAIHRVDVHTLVDEVAHHVLMAFGCGEVERGTAVVIRAVEICATGHEPL